MHLFAALYLVSACVDVLVGIDALARDPRSRANRSFAVLCAVLGTWALCSAIGVGADDVATCIAMDRVTSIAWCLIGPNVVHFALCLARPAARAPGWLWALLASPAFASAALVLSGRSPYAQDFRLSPLGWIPVIGPDGAWFGVSVVVSAACVGWGAFQVFLWGRRTTLRRERRQSRLILRWGAPILAAIVALDGVVPMVHGHVAPVVLPILAALWVAVIAYTIRRYRLLSLTPADVAGPLLQHLGDLVLLQDRSARIVEANRGALDLLGRRRDDIVGRPSSGVLPDGIAALLQDEGSLPGLRRVETVIPEPGRDGIPVALTISRIEDELGDRIGVLAVGRDLRPEERLRRETTKRRRVEADLAARSEEMSVTLDSIADGVVTTDVDGRIRLFNPAAAALTGWAADDASGRPLAEVVRLMSGTGSPLALLPARDATGAADARRHDPREALLLDRTGRGRPVDVSVAHLQDRAGDVTGWVLALRDAASRRHAEDERVRTSKMESVEQLAGGLAHDFNNLLAAALGNLSLVELDEGNPRARHERVREARQALERGHDLSRRLLALARTPAPVRRPVAIGDLLRGTCSLVLAGSTVQAEFDVAPDVREVIGDDGQIQHALGNLVLNARQAMPDGGRLAVSVANERAGHDGTGPGSRLQPPLDAGEWVRVEIRDEGIGIPPELQARIFDPFFTTKPGGTGLGLATVHTVVKQHRGRLAVRSTVGAGTVFTLWLPAAGPATAGTPHPDRSPASLSLRVLVMDDDPQVGRMLAEMLGHAGCSATLCPDGAEAVERYRLSLRGERYDVVLTDHTVPGGMGGIETAARIRAIDPGARLVLVSGNPNRLAGADLEAQGFRAFLQKPFTMEDLLSTLHDAAGPDARVVATPDP